jgi:hypothetical protein
MVRTLLQVTGIVAASIVYVVGALAEVSKSDSAASLRKRFAELRVPLEQSPIQRGLHLESAETSNASQGDVYAIVDYPFATVRDAFTVPANWCEALILHLNVKYCHAAERGDHTVLSLAIGKKIEQPLSETHRVELQFQVMDVAAGYAHVTLNASKGPFDTEDYRMSLEWIALDGARSFMHLQYSYAYGPLAGIAMRAYLATSGSRKVGFSRIATDNNGSSLVGGMRGALERNTMRYYLAVDTYLATLAVPASQRFEQRLERWFTATERHALQLHELDHDAYLTMKRHEYLRQKTIPGDVTTSATKAR